jgi:hypothetical protein
MVVVLEDDGCLHLYPTVADVARAVEALDAEDSLRAVFDHDGQRYRIEWIRPNTRHWLGVANGEYRLVADGAPSAAELLALIGEHPAIDQKAELVLRDCATRLRR